ncbi:acetate uptake transporter family protein KNAG_0H01830 [Huiozyma naganishii CBS 8797]|uniref:Uncharacterized protein n=1 Tax=Huiozyma naganishii (strain ATCC MYA-139 / BCRC 22969 / CBS 8797 / KCTC 17520 / NBRC 10181 / NCYC 3082 / Yp74L-3) TaxID=1071383 RepID=J7S1R9_HUIN7|nr:hypothetical protein KNAG_0H01830 [Kazachstania naganishii CBS 8797]CCK71597.1 hypothetical protein KNAG_0H01830 [Kazachstania naganishii CBS 8797]
MEIYIWKGQKERRSIEIIGVPRMDLPPLGPRTYEIFPLVGDACNYFSLIAPTSRYIPTGTPPPAWFISSDSCSKYFIYKRTTKGILVFVDHTLWVPFALHVSLEHQQYNNLISMSDKEIESVNSHTHHDDPATLFEETHRKGSGPLEEDPDAPESIQRIYTGGANNEYIYIGRQKFLREDLVDAFGGTLNPGLAPVTSHKFGNPAPLGLSGFALTTFILSMFNARAQGVVIPNVVVGAAMFYGGLVQLIAGIWEIALENTFGGTALCSYGGFWLSFGAIYIPWFGILDAYKEKESDLGNALGFYLLGWAIFTFGLSLCTMKSTVMFFALFFLLAITFLLLSISEFTGRFSVKRAGGYSVW